MKKVLFGEQKFGEKSVGFIELSYPQALNALDTQMLADIEQRLKSWENDSEIAMIFIHSENPRAFCAGGDVKSLAIQTRDQGIYVAENFFTQEYFTDAYVHSYKKPILAWLDGITMGGGIGLTQGASHRVVTDRTVLSMPEVFIGLFPDVGGSGFLPRLKDGFGYFIGLSGARLSGTLGVEMGWQNYILKHTLKRKVISDILRLEWQKSDKANSELLTGYLQHVMSIDVTEKSPAVHSDEKLLNHWNKIKADFQKALAGNDFEKLIGLVNETEGADGRHRSLLSQALFYELARQFSREGWNKILSQEWIVSVEMSRGTSFYEGVRAVLIDKDQKPNWLKLSTNEALSQAQKIIASPIENHLANRFKSFK